MAKRSNSAVSKGNPRGKRDNNSTALLTTISTNLKRLRTRQGHSLERLAKLAGVSRAMLEPDRDGQERADHQPAAEGRRRAGRADRQSARRRRPRASPSCCRRTAPRSSVASNGRFTSRAPVSARRQSPRGVLRGAHRGQHREQRRAAGRRARRRTSSSSKGRIELAVGNEQPVVACRKATRSSSTPTCRTAIATSMLKEAGACTSCVDGTSSQSAIPHPHRVRDGAIEGERRRSRDSAAKVAAGCCPASALSMGVHDSAYLSLIVLIPLSAVFIKSARSAGASSGTWLRRRASWPPTG